MLFTPPMPHPCIIHLSTVPAMQSSFRYREAWVKVGMRRRVREECGWVGVVGGDSYVRGWMRGGKQERGGAVMLSNLVRGSFFLYGEPPYRLGY